MEGYVLSNPANERPFSSASGRPFPAVLGSLLFVSVETIS